MGDVKDKMKWNEMLCEFRNFADDKEAEFVHQKFPDGKECVMVKLYYVKKGESYVKST